MNNKDRYELYNKLVKELEAENRTDHPAAVDITPLYTQDRVKVSLQIEYESIIYIDNDRLETEEDVRLRVNEAINILKPKLITAVREWVEGV